MERRLNITMPLGLLVEVDERARREHHSRSGLIREALKSYLRGQGAQEPVVAQGRSAAVPTPRALEAPPAPPKVLADRLRAFCAACDDIVAAYLFGSAATGKAGRLSDVDVALLLEAPPKQTDLPKEADPLGIFEAGRGFSPRQADLASRLPVALQVPRVDVVVLNAASVALAYRAVTQGHLVVGTDDPARVGFEVRLLYRYLDHLPLARAYANALRARTEGVTRLLDKDLVYARLDRMRTILGELQQALPEDIAALAAPENTLRRRAVERCLYLAIQHLLDIGSHIVAAESWGLPGSYREVIEKLGEHGVLPRDFARRLAPMAGFRNILEHEYVALDFEELVRNARRFDDFDRFAEHVVRYLES